MIEPGFPCQAGPMWAHVILATGQVVTTCFMGWVGLRMQDAKHDREQKYRLLQLELQHAKNDVVAAVTNGAEHER